MTESKVATGLELGEPMLSCEQISAMAAEAKCEVVESENKPDSSGAIKVTFQATLWGASTRFKVLINHKYLAFFSSPRLSAVRLRHHSDGISISEIQLGEGSRRSPTTMVGCAVLACSTPNPAPHPKR